MAVGLPRPARQEAHGQAGRGLRTLPRPAQWVTDEKRTSVGPRSALELSFTAVQAGNEADTHRDCGVFDLIRHSERNRGPWLNTRGA